MPSPEFTALARWSEQLIAYGEELGLSRRDLLETANLREDQLRDPDSRVPVTASGGLWWFMANNVDDPELGLRFGARLRIRDVGLVGYTMLFSKTLMEALERLVRYRHILSERAELSLTELEIEEQVVLETSDPNFFDWPPQAMDGELAAILSVCREITGHEIEPVEVRFAYGEPPRVAGLEEFFRAPLRFGHASGGIVFRRRDVELPVNASDQSLSGYIDSHAESVLRAIEPGGTFVEQVRRALWRQLSSGRPTLPGLAGEMNLSTRTMQRRLQESGTSFAGILDDFRKDMAVRLLLDKTLAVYEIAFLLGYSEPSTFYRAFKRWMDVSPQEFRRTIEAEPTPGDLPTPVSRES